MDLLILTRQGKAGLVEVPHAAVPGAGARRSVQIRSPEISLCRVGNSNNFTCVGLPFDSFHSLTLGGRQQHTHSPINEQKDVFEIVLYRLSFFKPENGLSHCLIQQRGKLGNKGTKQSRERKREITVGNEKVNKEKKERWKGKKGHGRKGNNRDK